MNRAELLECVIDTARAAGRVILAVYGTDFEIRSKADASPLTEADEKSEAIIRSGLKSLSPGVPIVSEEAASAADRDNRLLRSSQASRGGRVRTSAFSTLYFRRHLVGSFERN